MGAKKKGKKKSSSSSKAGGKNKQSNAGAAGIDGGLGALTLSSPSASAPAKLDDVSPLLFNHNNDRPLPVALPFIGPISIAEQVNEGGGNGESAAVIHGRGLITTRDVSSGECLFVTPSIVSADAAQVCRLYLQEEGGKREAGAAALERITENHLVEKVQSLCEIVDDEEIQPKENVDRARRLLQAFSAQMSSEEVPKTENLDDLMGILVASESLVIRNKGKMTVDRDTTLKIIRRNAFGPDYHNYDAIAQCWSKRPNSDNCYNRLLAAYPLSAVINHSCSPNAVRVYGRIPSDKSKNESVVDNIQGREVMIVHASANIPKGTEITWSYLPPSTPFSARREKLQSNYGFTCQCKRCIKEEEALNVPGFKELWAIADNYWILRDTNQHNEIDTTMMNVIPSMENVFASKQLSNEAQRYLRVGYASLYMESFNKSLSFEHEESMSQVLKLATQLHFSFVSCNNVSTEHLSIIHLCYDLSAMLHNRAMKGNDPDTTAKTHTQVKFWTEQLKKAMMVRYGKLGEDLENVREVMKHSKLVLRNRDGWYLTKHRFI